MENNNTLAENILGIAGTLLVSIALFPQVYKVFKTKSVNDLSMKWLIIECLSSILWIAYGILKNDLLIILTNAVISFSHILLTVARYMYRKTG
jgi:MtN3 and saliva related transmembrane protein